MNRFGREAFEESSFQSSERRGNSAVKFLTAGFCGGTWRFMNFDVETWKQTLPKIDKMFPKYALPLAGFMQTPFFATKNGSMQNAAKL